MDMDMQFMRDFWDMFLIFGRDQRKRHQEWIPVIEEDKKNGEETSGGTVAKTRRRCKRTV